MRGSMVSWTSAAFPSFRFRFELLDEARCRSPGLRRSNLPVAVTLNRLATAFLVLRRATGFGMGGGTVHGRRGSATFFGKKWDFGHARVKVFSLFGWIHEVPARLSSAQLLQDKHNGFTQEEAESQDCKAQA